MRVFWYLGCEMLLYLAATSDIRVGWRNYNTRMKRIDEDGVLIRRLFRDLFVG
jgi:hypothetical protein